MHILHKIPITILPIESLVEEAIIYVPIKLKQVEIANIAIQTTVTSCENGL